MGPANFYDRLAATAQEFVLATSVKQPGTNETDPERFLAVCAPEFKQTWGHKHFVSTNHRLQGERTAQQFLEHQAGMAARFQTWQVDVTDVLVDEKKRSAMVRADFWMHVKGQEQVVLNDIVYKVVMDEAGEKVVEAIEFVDPVAGALIATQMGFR